jgi:NADH-quinone oxidoreductase subunit N
MELGIYLQDLSLTIPLIVLFVLSLLPVTVKIFSGNVEQKQLFTFLQAAFAVILTGVLIVLRNTTEVVYAFNNTIVFSPYIKLTTIILVLSTLFTLFLGYRSPSIPKNQYSEHVFLLLNALLGMLVLNYSNDLLITFIGIELLSLPLYVLVGLSGNSVVPKEASFKYFVLGSFASAFLLFGIAFIFGATQTTEITKILSASEQVDKNLLTIGIMAFLVGMFFKVALVPFHSWLPDVYQGSPTPMTAFMATTVKLVIFVFLRGELCRWMVSFVRSPSIKKGLNVFIVYFLKNKYYVIQNTN